MTNARTARSAREKAAELRAQSARKDARRRAVFVSLSVLAALLVLIGAGVIIQIARQESLTAAGTTPPRNLVDGSYMVGDVKAPVTLTVYEDFICPGCRTFETATRSRIEEWVKDGTVRVAYRPLAFLDEQSTDEYSSRATNAAAAVLDLAPDGFAAFHESLFAEQPAEGGPGLPDSKLIDLAVAAGAPRAEVTKAIKDRSFRGWVASFTESANKAGVSQTPTIQVNGRTLDKAYDMAVFTAEVEKAIEDSDTKDSDTKDGDTKDGDTTEKDTRK